MRNAAEQALPQRRVPYSLVYNSGPMGVAYGPISSSAFGAVQAVSFWNIGTASADAEVPGDPIAAARLVTRTRNHGRQMPWFSV